MCSLYKGNTPIAGIGKFQTNAGWNIFDCKWSDHILNDIQWLRSDTFSWQSGSVYTTAYNHLVSDISGITAETETIGSYTVTFYRATDGHKICLADQESTVANIFSSTGIAWYYILDTTNTQFKLPRTKWGFEGLRDTVGNKIEESLPNITGTFNLTNHNPSYHSYTGAFQQGTVGTMPITGLSDGSFWSEGWGTVTEHFNANSSNSTYQDNAPVQERATQMYLYFYVGEYSQTAIEQTAGITSEQLNNKLNITGDTMTGRLTCTNGLSIDNGGLNVGTTSQMGSIELYGGGTGWGGYIDFHNGSDTGDYTSRIVETSSGVISINGSNGVYVKQSYVNGTSGYMVWTNGYCEQWGTSTAWEGDTRYSTVTFLKTFANTNYSVLCQGEWAGMDNGRGWWIYSKTASTVRFASNSASTPFYWIAVGYLASGQY